MSAQMLNGNQTRDEIISGLKVRIDAAMRGYAITLIMPDNMTQERKDAMRAYGAELRLVSPTDGCRRKRISIGSVFQP